VSLALADSLKVTELESRVPGNWGALAELYSRLRQPEEAIAAYSKAIQAAEQAGQNPSSYWYCRGETHCIFEKWDKAVQDYSRAIELLPTNPAYLAARGAAYVELGEAEKALADCNQAIKNEDPSNGSVGLAARCKVYEKLGRWKEAFADYTELTNRFPSNYRYRWRLAEKFLYCPDRTFRDPRRALELAKEAVRLLPKSLPSQYPWGVRRIAGLAHYRLGEWNEAVAALTAEVEPYDAESQFSLAMAHWQLGNKDEARKWYDRGAEANRKYPNGYAARETKAEAEALLNLTPPKEPANKPGP
jgi:tetratricopeptide (TPR) repeat protein